jgi:hypothetical protein
MKGFAFCFVGENTRTELQWRARGLKVTDEEGQGRARQNVLVSGLKQRFSPFTVDRKTKVELNHSEETQFLIYS